MPKIATIKNPVKITPINVLMALKNAPIKLKIRRINEGFGFDIKTNFPQ
jgi:hypothetical protein